MEIEHEDKPVANATSDYQSSVQVDTQNVTYATVNDMKVTGYLARPENVEGATPGIIVIHEMRGTGSATLDDDPATGRAGLYRLGCRSLYGRIRRFTRPSR
ncbi:MAG: hypothetical protein U5K69_14875 [Balneolaceae bacterium]|nr:hypothetical protein [Balneolaceae bacterium]